MPVHSLKFFLSRVFACALILLTPHLVFGQAAGPQRVPIPPPLAKNASKPKTDRSSLPQIPIFKDVARSEEHTSELQSHLNLVCRLLLEKKTNKKHIQTSTHRRCSLCVPSHQRTHP